MNSFDKMSCGTLFTIKSVSDTGKALVNSAIERIYKSVLKLIPLAEISVDQDSGIVYVLYIYNNDILEKIDGTLLSYKMCACLRVLFNEDDPVSLNFKYRYFSGVDFYNEKNVIHTNNFEIKYGIDWLFMLKNKHEDELLELFVYTPYEEDEVTSRPDSPILIDMTR